MALPNIDSRKETWQQYRQVKGQVSINNIYNQAELEYIPIVHCQPGANPSTERVHPGVHHGSDTEFS